MLHAMVSFQVLVDMYFLNFTDLHSLLVLSEADCTAGSCLSNKGCNF